MAGWCTIESDPGVFTELISKFGVKGVQVEECYDLDSLAQLKPVYGLVFLFKWQKETGTRVVLDDVPGLFFAKQVIQDACATQAILSILLNRPELDIGDTLKNFKEFTMQFASEDRGMALTNSEEIRLAHNSFKRPEPFVLERDKDDKGDSDAFHFITYVPFGGNLYELDGLQRGPILLGECKMDNWIEAVKPHIQERIAKYAQSEIRFNLMGLIANRKEVMTRELEALENAMDVSSDGSTGSRIAELRAKINDEEEKYKRWKVENIRRRHNYVPFIFTLLKILAEKDALSGLVADASKRYQATEEAKKASASSSSDKKATKSDGGSVDEKPSTS